MFKELLQSIKLQENTDAKNNLQLKIRSIPEFSSSSGDNIITQLCKEATTKRKVSLENKDASIE